MAGKAALACRAAGAAMKRLLRLKDNTAFQRVYREGQSWTTPLVVLRASPNGFPHSRIGFSTSKRLGSAVVRNRVKRRLREAVRAASADLPGGLDLVLIARESARSAAFDQLLLAVRQLLAQSRQQWQNLPPPLSGEAPA